MNNKLIKYSMSVLFLIMIAIGMPTQQAAAAKPATLKVGSTDADVPDLQYRLKTMGYFNSTITSYFGSATFDSLIKFQKEHGLTADGIAGSNTWTVLKSVSVNQAELDMLAKIIYAESRGEPYEGQVAVGAVVMNRVEASGFPDSVEEVIEQPRAFTAVDDGQYKLKPDSRAYQAAEEAVKGNDPTDGALYYFNPETATSKWIWTRTQTGKIGRHVFAV